MSIETIVKRNLVEELSRATPFPKTRVILFPSVGWKPITETREGFE